MGHPQSEAMRITERFLRRDFGHMDVETTFGDPKLYKVCAALFTCGAPMATDAGSEGLLKGNIEGAKKLLKEAAYDGTKVVLLQVSDQVEVTPYGPITAQALRAIGLNVDMQVMDWNTPAIDFYEKLGATVLKEWIAVRLDGEKLKAFARG